MPYENLYRNEEGHLRLPFGALSLLLRIHKVSISAVELPAVENMTQFLSSAMILAGRLRDHLERYEENTWVNVPFDELFLDTQSLVLFFRQFMEDVSFVIRVALPKKLRSQMPAGFGGLLARIIDKDLTKDPELAAALPESDPLRRFLVLERAWFQKVKDLRDDICHRSAYGRLRTSTFPGLIDLIIAGGGKAPFAYEADLRSYLRGLFQRWLAFACLTSEFVRRRIQEQHPSSKVPFTDGFIIRHDEIDFIQKLPLGTTVMSVSPPRLDALEYFVGDMNTKPQ